MPAAEPAHQRVIQHPRRRLSPHRRPPAGPPGRRRPGRPARPAPASAMRPARSIRSLLQQSRPVRRPLTQAGVSRGAENDRQTQVRAPNAHRIAATADRQNQTEDAPAGLARARHVHRGPKASAHVCSGSFGSSSGSGVSRRGGRSAASRTGRGDHLAVGKDPPGVVENDHAVAQQAPALLGVEGDRASGNTVAAVSRGAGGPVGAHGAPLVWGCG